MTEAAPHNNLDYCGIVFMLRRLVVAQVCTEKEARNIAARIAADMDTDIHFPL